MFKLQKISSRTSKQGERVEFRFSNFQVLQVPKGWDRLYLSVTSAETGKLVAKSGKALVKNGNCQWPETISESLWISQNDSSKDSEESLIKLVVSTGLGRYGILGEVAINMSQYAGARVSTAVSLPLKKCSYGTLLQVKIQRLSPRSKIRNEDSKSTNSEDRDQREENRDMPSNSNDSDDSNHSRDRTVGPRTRDLSTSTPRLLKLESKMVRRAVPDQYDKVESFEETEINNKESSFSNDDVKSEELTPLGERIDRGYEDSPLSENQVVEDRSSSNHSSFNSRQYVRADSQNETVAARSSASVVSSSRNLLEAAEDTIEELRAEAKMWERNARKLAVDMDVSRKEFSDLSRKKVELDVQLSSANGENDGLKREIEKLKLKLQESRDKLCTEEDSSFQSESLMNIQKILENEIKYHQSLNSNLGEQLKQSQESNIQLVSILQELEETIEQQRAEIDNLSSLKSHRTDLEKKIERISEENNNLLQQLQKLQESEKTLQADIRLLENAVKDKTVELENAGGPYRQSLLTIEKDYKSQISLKEKEIERLEENLTRHVNEKSNELREIQSLREKVEELEKDCTELTHENLELLIKLKEPNKADIIKCPSFDSISSEHAVDCPSDDSDASDPKTQISNLDEELEQKANEETKSNGFEGTEKFGEISKLLEEALHILIKPWYGVSSNANEASKIFILEIMNAIQEKATAERICSFLHEMNAILESRITECEDVLRGHKRESKERSFLLVEAERKMEECILEVEKHERSKTKLLEDHTELMKELDEKASQVDLIQGELHSKELENKLLIHCKMELEAEITEISKEKSNLEQNIELVLRERDAISECVENLQNDVEILRKSVDSHVSANTILESKSNEMEREKDELGSNMAALQEEKLQLQERVFDLEARIRSLKDENDSFKQETDSFRSAVTRLQGEIQKQKGEMESEMVNIKQKSEDMNEQWLEAQKECENLKEDNRTLQESAATSIQENIKLQNLNMKLHKENQELHQSISEMVAQLTKSSDCLEYMTKKVEWLEDHFDSVFKNFSTREDCLKSEIDALLEEIRNREEKIALGESLNQEFLDMTFKLENRIKIEVEHLSRQISDVRDEKERISSEAANEVSRLCAEKSEIQVLLQEAMSDAELMKNTFDSACLESELKLEVLTAQLAASQRSHEILLADHERNLKLLENYRKSEEKMMTDINDLELKLTISDYERQQFTKETDMLKVQLQNKSNLQDDIAILKEKLQECLTEKSKIEQSLQMEIVHYEEMKTENVLLSGKISKFQVALSECEETKRKKLILEEKLQQMEHDQLTTKEELHTQNSNLKSELAEVRRANTQFQLKIYKLEEEKDACFKKAQNVIEELELTMGRSEISEEEAKDDSYLYGSPHERFISSSRNSLIVSSKKSAFDGAVTRKMYDRTKSSLETELRDLRDRYLQMSLKYAEVEAQREDLVMKLKASHSGKRWLS